MILKFLFSSYFYDLPLTLSCERMKQQQKILCDMALKVQVRLGGAPVV
jgi:hypothetical protein